jgi:hypothetical protein
MSSTRNKQDANASTLAQQEVEGSMQPKKTLLTVLPQGEQNAIVLQFKSEQPRGKPIGSLLISVAIILIAVGAIVWVLNITAVIEGPWANVCTALFTSVATIIALLQPYQFTTAPTGPYVAHICRREMTAKVTLCPERVVIQPLSEILHHPIGECHVTAPCRRCQDFCGPVEAYEEK